MFILLIVFLFVFLQSSCSSFGGTKVDRGDTTGNMNMLGKCNGNLLDFDIVCTNVENIARD